MTIKAAMAARMMMASMSFVCYKVGRPFQEVSIFLFGLDIVGTDGVEHAAAALALFEGNVDQVRGDADGCGDNLGIARTFDPRPPVE